MRAESKIKYIVLSLILIFLVFPRPASADFLGIIDFFNGVALNLKNSFGALGFIEVLIMFANLTSLIFLAVSAAFLDRALDNSPDWLTVNNNPMVQAGWHFTAGLANLFIVIVLIVLAFGFILKIESFQARKTLPRLIIVALLLNFSLVFIGALIDIANILYKTIHDIAGAFLIAGTAAPLASSVSAVVFELSFFLALKIGLAALGPLGAIPQVVAAMKFFVSLLYLPTAFNWLINAFFAYVMAGIFVVFTFIFTARVIIVQMLAIVSPLIFLCWALPPLKKYWDEWLNHLLQWLFFGLILYFFMVIGMKMANFLMPPASTQIVANMPGIALIGIYYSIEYYTFLFIYLVVIIFFAQRLTPILAQSLLKYAAVWGGALAVGGTALLKGAREDYGITARNEQQKEKEKWDKKSKEYAEAGNLDVAKKFDWSKRHELSKEDKAMVDKELTEGMGFWEKRGRGLSRVVVGAEETANRLQGTSINEKTRQARLQAQADAAKIEDTVILQERASQLRSLGKIEESNAYLDRLKGKNLGDKDTDDVLGGWARKEAKNMKGTTDENLEERKSQIIRQHIQAAILAGDTAMAAKLGRNHMAEYIEVVGRAPKEIEEEYKPKVERAFGKFEDWKDDKNKQKEIDKLIEAAGGKPEDMSAEAKYDFLIRSAQLLARSDSDEIGYFRPKFAKAAVPLITQTMNFEQRLLLSKFQRLPYQEAEKKYFDDKGLTWVSLNVPNLQERTGFPATAIGGASLGISDDNVQALEGIQNWINDKDHPERKKSADDFESSLSPEEKEKMTEILRMHPKRLKETADPASAAILRMELQGGGAAAGGGGAAAGGGSAAQARIAELEAQIAAEEKKGPDDIGSGPNWSNISKYKEEIRQQKIAATATGIPRQTPFEKKQRENRQSDSDNPGGNNGTVPPPVEVTGAQPGNIEDQARKVITGAEELNKATEAAQAPTEQSAPKETTEEKTEGEKVTELRKKLGEVRNQNDELVEKRVNLEKELKGLKKYQFPKKNRIENQIQEIDNEIKKNIKRNDEIADEISRELAKNRLSSKESVPTNEDIEGVKQATAGASASEESKKMEKEGTPAPRATPKTTQGSAEEKPISAAERLEDLQSSKKTYHERLKDAEKEVSAWTGNVAKGGAYGYSEEKSKEILEKKKEEARELSEKHKRITEEIRKIKQTSAEGVFGDMDDQQKRMNIAGYETYGVERIKQIKDDLAYEEGEKAKDIEKQSKTHSEFYTKRINARIQKIESLKEELNKLEKEKKE